MVIPKIVILTVTARRLVEVVTIIRYLLVLEYRPMLKHRAVSAFYGSLFVAGGVAMPPSTVFLRSAP